MNFEPSQPVEASARVQPVPPINDISTHTEVLTDPDPQGSVLVELKLLRVRISQLEKQFEDYRNSTALKLKDFESLSSRLAALEAKNYARENPFSCSFSYFLSFLVLIT